MPCYTIIPCLDIPSSLRDPVCLVPKRLTDEKPKAPPRNPIILAHGLLGFTQLTLLSLPLPYTYFSGISPALKTHSIAHHATTVPPTSSIPSRASHLAAQIAALYPDTPVNVVAHSMGGLDARHMLSRLDDHPSVRVASLVTIGSPHRGSVVADRVLASFGGTDGLARLLAPLGFEADGIAQLTRSHMASFNAETPDVDGVRYFSYGATMDPPGLLSPFRRSHALLAAEEGENDGLVSVESSRWGRYMGTLVGVSHLDLINWSNNLAWTVKGWMGVERSFNAEAFYLGIADMLAKEGL